MVEKFDKGLQLKQFIIKNALDRIKNEGDLFNLSYEFLFFEIQEILAANDKIFPEGNSQSAIFEGKRLAVVTKSLEYHEDKLITQVFKPVLGKKKVQAIV